MTTLLGWRCLKLHLSICTRPDNKQKSNDVSHLSLLYKIGSNFFLTRLGLNPLFLCPLFCTNKTEMQNIRSLSLVPFTLDLTPQ